jgi:DNA protecting protein DprA
LKLQLHEIILLKYLTKYNIKLIKEYANTHDDFDAIITTLFKKDSVDNKIYIEAVTQTKIALDKLQFYSIKTITIFEDNYPICLKNISDAPPVIYYKGVLKTDKLAAVIGSRKVSKHARKITHQVVDWLNDFEFGVVSGLALGIDTLAHERAVENKQYTMAVLPNSLDTIYPPTNYKLANDIIDAGGCLISEMIFGINRGKQSFVQRNRIQAAFSHSVIPIEMGVASGTMHTIDFAKRYKKNVALFKPTPMLSELENYFGILHLINNPNKFQSIFTDKDSLANIINSKYTDQQLDLEL